MDRENVPKKALTFDEPNHKPALVGHLIDAEYRVQIMSPLMENAVYKSVQPNSTNGGSPSDIKVITFIYTV